MFAFSSISIQSQTLVLHHNDGTKTDVELYTQPQIKFLDEKVIVTSPMLNLEFPKEQVLRFTYRGKTSGINVLNDAECAQEADRLVFHGIQSADKVTVHRSNGIRVPVQLIQEGDNVLLPLSSLASGVYILSVNGNSSKFVKR